MTDEEIAQVEDYISEHRIDGEHESLLLRAVTELRRIGTLESYIAHLEAQFAGFEEARQDRENDERQASAQVRQRLLQELGTLPAEQLRQIISEMVDQYALNLAVTGAARDSITELLKADHDGAVRLGRIWLPRMYRLLTALGRAC